LMIWLEYLLAEMAKRQRVFTINTKQIKLKTLRNLVFFSVWYLLM